MAVSEWGVNHPLARKHYGDELMKEALKATQAVKFMGTDAKSLCHVKTETQKNKGDTITFGLRLQLQGAGVQGDATLEGNEESLAVYTDSVAINHLRHAVRSAGKMSEQRVPFTVRDENRDGLADWWSDRIDTWFFNQLAGNRLQGDTRYTGHQATLAPSTNHLIKWDDSAAAEHATGEESLSESDVFKLHLIDYAVEVAKTLGRSKGDGEVPMRPIRYQGEDVYVMFLDPAQVTSLRTHTASGNWQDIQKAAMNGGDVKDNPIFTGALGMYNNVILHETTRLPTGMNSTTSATVTNTRRAVLCGAQAAAMAFGVGHSPGKFDWNEELFDYGNQLGVAAGCIAGLKKCQFNSVDFGTLVVSTYAKRVK